jgi:hypothetical protein
MTTSPRQLFCFDFDNTMVNAHFHAILEGQGVQPKKATAAQIQSLLNENQILNHKTLLEIFKQILSNGHHIAITTWSEYPEVIVPTLQKLGLNPAEIAMIHIESGLPQSGQDRKSQHIKRAKKHFGIEDNIRVCLIDDDERNIIQARKEGQIGIHVKDGQRDTEYLSVIKNTILTKKRVSIAPMDSREGQRLYDIRKNLKAKGKVPAPFRQDGEQPLARFLAKAKANTHEHEPRAKKVRGNPTENSWTTNVLDGALSAISYVAKPLTFAFNTGIFVDTARRFMGSELTQEAPAITYKSLCKRPSRK